MLCYFSYSLCFSPVEGKAKISIRMKNVHLYIHANRFILLFCVNICLLVKRVQCLKSDNPHHSTNCADCQR